MRKFLSILMLACLLWGLALPAAAEGEPQLYVKVGDGTCTNQLTIAEGFTQTVKFYTDAGGNTPFTATPSIADETNISLTTVESSYQIKANKTTETPVSINADGYSPVSVSVISSQLEIRRADGTWGSALSGIKVGESAPVEFRLTAGGESVPYMDAITVNPADGLTYSGGTLTATKAGTYTLSCKYSGTVTVTAAAAVLSADDLNTSALLNGVLQSKAKLEEYLSGKGYPTSGDITIQLPESIEYEDPITIGEGMDGVTLTLQGNKNTFKKGLVVKGGNNTINGISFTSAPAITLENVAQCAVSNCKFSGMPFKIQTKSKENGGISAPELVLTSNTYTGTTIELAKVVDPNGKECIWLADPKAAPTTAVLNLGVAISEYISGSTLQALSFDVDYSVDGLLENKWGLNLLLPCGFESAYTVCNGEKGLGEKATKYSGYYKVNVSEAGKYAVIDGSYPQLQDGKVIIREVDAAFLYEVTVDTTYTNAVVKLGTKQVPSSINNKKLTFQLDKAGTYTVTATTAATTKSTTKTTTTTSRSYNYKYQDYYLITPQRVTDCMRYAKDNLVTIECKEAGRRSISLPVVSMAAAAEKGYSILLKNEKIADITLDAAALKSMAQQAKGTTVLLHYRSLNHKTLTTVGLASVQSHLDQFPNDNADLAFLVTATSDSETIEDLQLGTITLKIPFIVLPGTEEMKNEVYALQTETAASARETTVADGHLTTKLTDLTEHMVFQIGEPVETTEETTEPTVETTVETTQPETVPETTLAPAPEVEEKGFPIWIPIVAVLLLGGGGAAAWFLYLRKRFQK